MSIVNRDGRLFKLKEGQDLNKRGKWEFELVEDAPQLAWDHVVSKDYRVTTDGRIFCIDENKVLETRESGFKDVMRYFDDFHSDVCIKVLLHDGRVFRYQLNGEGEEIDNDVSYITSSDNIKNQPSNDELCTDMGEYGNIVGVNDDVIITDTHICTIESQKNGRFIERRGKLIGVSRLVICLNHIDIDGDYTLIMEEEDGELMTRLWNPIAEDEDDCIHNNDILSDMHKLCPWVDVIEYSGEPYLVNANGHSVKIVDQCGIVGSKIPDYVFAPSVVKNARSSEYNR